MLREGSAGSDPGTSGLQVLGLGGSRSVLKFPCWFEIGRTVWFPWVASLQSEFGFNHFRPMGPRTVEILAFKPRGCFRLLARARDVIGILDVLSLNAAKVDLDRTAEAGTPARLPLALDWRSGSAFVRRTLEEGAMM